MIVYVDILFIQNFLIDFILILLTLQTLRIYPSYRYITIGALFGAMYVLTKLFSSLQILDVWPIQVLTAIFIMIISTKKKNVSYLIKSTLIFIGYSMLLSGLCYYLTMMQKKPILKVSYKTLILTFTIMYLISYRVIIFSNERKLNKILTYSVFIHIDNLVVCVDGFIDTGNELREPISNLPVVIVEESVFRDINIPDDKVIKIPFSVVNSSDNTMDGFRPDYIEIERKNHNNIKTKAVIGISCSTLNESGEYNAILPKESIDYLC